VSKIHGKGRIKGVTVSRVDEKLQPIPGESEYIPCDTLLLSCGLIPENELTKEAGIALDRVTGGAVVNERRETTLPGVFACGNVLHVHDLVDYVSEEAELAGRSAAAFVQGGVICEETTALRAEGGIRYTVPQRIQREAGEVRVYFRVGRIMKNALVTVRVGDQVIFTQKKRRMAPGEMECICLSADQVAQLQGEAVITAEEVTA
jgi:hypothetical protein